MKQRLIPVIAIVLCCCTAASADAADIGKKWHEELQRTDRLLIAGEYQEARKVSSKIADQMVDRMGPGDKSSSVLGLVLTYRALAEAGLGNPEAALWDWHVALNLDPDLSGLDLGAFGEHGEFLKGHPLADDVAAIDCAGVGEDSICQQDGREIEPVKIRKRPRPVYPRGARAFRTSGRLVVRVVIGEDGSVSAPKVIEALPAPTLSYVALEAVRRWTFEPARIAGEPVAAYYQLTVNYELRR